jgi:hypothetical protein
MIGNFTGKLRAAAAAVAAGGARARSTVLLQLCSCQRSISETARGAQAAVAARRKRARRIARVQLRRSGRELQKIVRRTQVATLMAGLRVQGTSGRARRYVLGHSNRWAATIVALIVCALFVTFVQEPDKLKTSEVHLTCAQVIGAALALILALSIIPAQRASEAFSPAILRLYAKDGWLAAAFLILAVATILSVLLGTGFLPILDPRFSLCIQFVGLGISLDALRLFYNRALNLLVPQTAVRLVIRECTRPLSKVTRLVNELARLQALSAGNDQPTDASRALLFAASPIPGALRFWTGQLDEIGHKFIAGRDTSATNDIIAALSNIGMQYSEARKNSVILLPDFDNLFAGGVSDISEVLSPIYESIRIFCEDAAKAPNELIVRQGIRTLANMTMHAMTMIHSSNGWKKAPLAFSGCYWLGLCASIAMKANMGDAVLAAVQGFQAILLAQKKDVDTADVETQSLESLMTIAGASYIAPSSVWCFPAVKAMLLAARHDIELNGYRDDSTLRKVLEYVRSLAPLKIIMEKAHKRRLQVFPPYDLSFEASIPASLEMVSHRVTVDTERPWTNPFDEFLEAAEDVRHHYAELSRTDFENTLARKWVVDSMIAAARVHWALLLRPPVGTEDHIDDIDQSLRSLISWIPGFFPAPSWTAFRSASAASE